MIFCRIITVIETLMPLIAGIGTAIVAGFFVPGIADRWASRKVRHNYRTLLSNFDKFCRSLGSETIAYPTIREEYFKTEDDVAKLIESDKSITPSIVGNWVKIDHLTFKTALNTSRSKAGLGSGNFYFSRHFLNDKCGELLAVLIIKDNIAKIKAFYRGDWSFPKKKKKSKLQRWLHRVKVRFFGYDRPDYSIMLV
jgi:hypothetical protein